MFLLRYTAVAILFAFLSFSRPAQASRDSADRGETAAAANRPYLGVIITPTTPETAAETGWNRPDGAVVLMVQGNSPAAKAGIQPRDILFEFNGKSIEEASQLGEFVRQMRPQRKAKLKVFRNGRVITLTALLATHGLPQKVAMRRQVDLANPPILLPDLPSPALRWQSQLLGIEYEGLEGQLASFFGVKQGVLIRFVRTDSAADAAGVKAGDVIVAINGQMLSSPRELALFCQRDGTEQRDIALDVVRDHKNRKLTVQLAGY